MITELPAAQVVCIAQAIYHEARGESLLGKRAVAHVVINRSKSREITSCQVIHQPNQFQFKVRKRYSGKDWESALLVAKNPGKDPTGGALFFRKAKIHGSWGHKITGVIGHHAFYK